MANETSMHTLHRNGFRAARGLRTGCVALGAALLLAGAAAGCDSAGREAADEPVPTAEAVAKAESASEPEAASKAEAAGGSVQSSAAEANGSANPLGGLVPPAPGQEQLVGVVAEHLPAGGYTYLWIEPEQGEPRWVVTMRRDVGAGDRVRVDSLGSRHDFYSRRLDRRFAELVFGVVEVVG